MNFKDLKKEIASDTGLTEKQVYDVLNSAEKLIYKKLVFGQEVYFYQIGKLQLKVSKARTVFNVSKREHVNVPARYRVSFNVSKKLRDRIASKTVHDG